MPTTTTFSPPYTVYAVAVYIAHSNQPGPYLLFNKMFVVSGRDPLTDDEAKSRGLKMVEEAWDEKVYGPRADYVAGFACVNKAVIG